MICFIITIKVQSLKCVPLIEEKDQRWNRKKMKTEKDRL